MEIKRCVLSAVLCVMFLALRAGAETAETASELIAQAHKHDNMYTLGPEASQQKALSFYQSALSAEPDEEQRLHILYRMAQLYGSSYDLTKGEKPDFQRAIELNKKIVDDFPPEEPLVYKAMGSICDHYTTLRQFEAGLKWAKKVLEYDTYLLDEQNKADEQNGSPKQAVDSIRRYQKIAVDQVAYTAEHIDYLQAHGELRAIIDKYHGTFIAERARKLLAENMDKMPDLWAPTNDEPFSPSGSTLQAADSAPTAAHKSQKGLSIQPDTTAEITEQRCSVEPNIIEKLQKDKYSTESRAPPSRYFKKYIVVAAKLIVIALAAILIMKRKTSFRKLKK